MGKKYLWESGTIWKKREWFHSLNLTHLLTTIFYPLDKAKWSRMLGNSSIACLPFLTCHNSSLIWIISIAHLCRCLLLPRITTTPARPPLNL
jgi:hypothetical protein